jgi:hypothetical protein
VISLRVISEILSGDRLGWYIWGSPQRAASSRPRLSFGHPERQSLRKSEKLEDYFLGFLFVIRRAANSRGPSGPTGPLGTSRHQKVLDGVSVEDLLDPL